MSNTVDNRVVEMRFNNEQFEKGVKETIASLDSLKEALKINTASLNLNSIQKAINGLSMDSIIQSLDQVAQRFSTLGIVGMNVINRITNGVIGLGQRIAAISIGQIITGGKGRAQKIADARFKLEGLLDTAEEVESAFTSASNAVDGTAYGLDSAVSIASQLAASSVPLGEKMDSALRGVAGLAAMTGSSFEDMGNIFATVAGNGRLMGMQLTQISSRGINVAAELAKQMNKTEGEIREMVSDGDISFQQFADAMNNAFGDQAQKANETLTGALDNVRAALSRIGEIFYSGIIENKDFIKFINDIRVAINGVKKAMEPLREPFKALITSASKLGSAILRLFNVDNGFSGFVDTVAGAITKIANFIDIFTDKINGIADRISKPLKAVQTVAKETAEVTSVVTDEIRTLAEEVWAGKHFNGAARIADLGEEVYNQVQPYVNAMKEANFDLAKADEIYAQIVAADAETVKEAKKKEKEATEDAAETAKKAVGESSSVNKIVSIISTTLWNIKKILAAVGNSIKKVFSKDKTVKILKNIVDALFTFTNKLAITDERAKKLEDGFTGLFGVVEMVASAIGNLVSGSLNVLGPILSFVLDVMLDVFSAVGKVVNGIRTWIENNKLLTTIGSKIVSIFTKVINICHRFYEGFVNLPAVREITGALKTFIKDVAEKLLQWFNDAADATDDFFDNFEGKDTDPIEVVLNGINSALEKLIGLAKDGKKYFTKAFDWVIKKTGELKEFAASIGDVFGGIENVKEAATDVAESDGPLDLINNLMDSFSGFGDKLGDFVNNVISKIKALDAAKIALFGLSSGITVLMFSISAFLVKSGKLVEAFTALPKAIINTLNSIGQAIRDLKKFFMLKAETKLILAIAAAIAVLVGSVYLLSKIPERQLIVAASAVAALVIVLEVMIGLLGSIAKNSVEVEGFNKTLWIFVAVIISMSVAVALLAYSIKTLSEIDWGKLNSWLGLGVLVVLLGSMVGIAILLAKFAPLLSMGGLGIISFAAAVYILVAALEKLTSLDLDFKEIKRQMKVLCMALLTVGAVALLASNMSFSGGLGVLLIIGSIYLIEKELQWLINNGVSLDDCKKHMDKIWPVLIALGVIGAYMVILSRTVKDAPNTIAALVGAALALIIVITAIKALTKVVENNESAYWQALLGIVGIMAMMALLIYTAAQTAQAARIKQAGNMFLKMAWALLIISAAVAVLSFIPEDKIVQGMVCVTLLMILMGGLIAVTKMAGNMNAKAIIAMVAVIAALTLFVALMSYMDDIISVLAAMGVIGLSLIAFGISMRLATRYINKNTERGIVAMLAVLTITIFGLVTLSEVIAHNGIKGVLAAAGAISAVMLFFGVAMQIMGKAFKGVQTDVLKNRMKMVEVFTVTLAMIALGLTAVLTTGANWSSILAAAGAISGVLLVMVGTMAILNQIKVDPGTMEGKAAAMLLASLALIPIAVALKILAGYKWEEMKGPLIAMVAVIAVIALALAGLSAIAKSPEGLLAVAVVGGILAGVMLAAAASMLIFSKALKGIIKGIKALTQINYDKIDTNKLNELVGLLLKLVGVIALAGLGLAVFGVGLVAITPGLLAIAVAIALVINAAKNFVKVFTPFLKVLVAFVNDADNVSKNIDKLGTSISKFMVKLANGFALGIQTFITNLAANIVYISTMLKLIILVIVKDILEIKVEVFNMILDALLDMVKMLANKLPELLGYLNEILVATLKSIAENSFEYGYYGGLIAIEFVSGLIVGLAEALPDLINAAIYAATMIGEAIKATFGQYKDAIGAGFKSTLWAGGAVVADMWYKNKKIWNPLPDESDKYIEDVIDYMTEKSLDEGKKAEGAFQSDIQQSANERVQSIIDAQTQAYKNADTSEAEEAATTAISKPLTNGYTSIKDDIKSISSDLKSQFKGSYDEMLDGGEEAIDEASQVHTEKLIRYTKGLPATLRDTLESELASQGWQKSVSGYMYKLVDVDEFGNKVTDNISKTMGDIPAEALSAMKENGWQLNETGTQIVKGVTDGAEAEGENNQGILNDVFGGLMDGDSIKAESYTLGGQSLSSYVDGWLDASNDPFEQNKIKLGTLNVTDQIDTTAKSKEGLDINSPSRKSKALGFSWIEGLVISLESIKSLNSVKDASLAVANGVIDTFATAIDTSHSLNTDKFQPTISPVLDDSNVQRYSGVLNTFTNPTTMQLAADSTMTVHNSDQARLATQIDNLSKEVDKLANKDFSDSFGKVRFNINANTTVDGKVLRRTASDYTIDQIDRKERAIIMSKGGRA